MATKHDVLNVLNSRYNARRTAYNESVDKARTALGKDKTRKADALAKQYNKKAHALYKSIVGCNMDSGDVISSYRFVKHVKEDKTLVANVNAAVKNLTDLDARYNSLREKILLEGATPELLKLINAF